MPYIKKKYYRIEETIKILQSKGATIGIEDLCSYTSEQLIRPIIYINSRAAHACETMANGDPLAVGHCFLSAYWNPPDMIAVFDTLVRDVSVDVHPLVKKIHLIEEPKIFSWQYVPYVFKRVPEGQVCPKPFSENLKLEYFMLLAPSPEERLITLTVQNLAITNQDLEFLIKSLTEPNLSPAEDTPHNKQTLSKENNISPDNYFKDLGEKGGDKEKIKEELLALALYELREHKRGYTAFKDMLEEDYLLESFPSPDDETYPGYGNCQDIYLIKNRIHYTLIMEDDKTERCEIAIKSLERYFTTAKKMIKQPA